MANNIFAPAPVSQVSFSNGVQLTADGFPKAKAGAAIIDWTTVTALTEDTYLPDVPFGGTGTQGTAGYLPSSDVRQAIPAGSKVVRYGTILRRDGATGMYVPAKTADTLVKGETYLVNETVVLDTANPNTNFAVAIDGGRVFKARILAGAQTSFGTQTDGGAVVFGDVYAGGAIPTFAQLEAVMPNISYAID